MQKQKQRTDIASSSAPSHRPSEENLPVLSGANRILWGRMGSAVLGCLSIVVAAILFDSCG